jgi:ubiquitin-like 1-activating enzyme E1 A
MVQINTLCRSKGIKFFATDVFGYYGFMFADLQSHT